MEAISAQHLELGFIRSRQRQTWGGESGLSNHAL